MKFQFPFVTLLVGVVVGSVIEDDLTQRISPQVTKLANDVQGFPDSGLDGALAIDADSKDLVIVLDTATENAKKEGPFSQSDGAMVQGDVNPVVSTLVELLQGLSAKKDDFNKLVLPAGPLILSDLQMLNHSTVTYVEALVEDAPLLQVPSFIAIRNTCAGAFAQALADYSSKS